jgi:hypothetical protein
VALIGVLAIVLTACGSPLGEPPAATPTDILGIAEALRVHGITTHRFVSGDAGCPDRDMTSAAIGFDAEGVDLPAPTRIRVFIFRNDESYQRLRPAVDACAATWLSEPAAYEAIDASPFVAIAEGPWTPGFRDAVRQAMTEAAGAGG